ncbi:MAG: hypothetical protein U0V64_02100 [Cyclobacteriaceae bacterium]
MNTMTMIGKNWSALRVTWFIVWGLGLFACSSPESPSKDSFGYQYLPLHVGDFAEYDVQSTRTLAGVPTLLEFQLRTEVVDSFANAEGGYSFVMHRSTRSAEADPWVPLDSWTLRRNDRQAVITENSTPYLKLSFPVSERRKWNGNAFNSREANEYCIEQDAFSCDMYEATKVGKPFSASATMNFEATVTVVENDNQDFISFQDKRIAIYAKDVGLVYREIDSLQYCTQPSCLGKQEIEKGHVYVQTIRAYGHR